MWLVVTCMEHTGLGGNFFDHDGRGLLGGVGEKRADFFGIWSAGLDEALRIDSIKVYIYLGAIVYKVYV